LCFIWDASLDLVRGKIMHVALKLNVAFALFVTSAIAAEAADMAVAPVVAPAVPISPWNAFYVGGFIGASAATQALNEQGAHQFFAQNGAGISFLSLPQSDPETTSAFDGIRGSFTGGALAGASYQFEELVFGVEADVAWKRTTLKGSQVAGEDATYAYTPYNCSGGAGDCIYDTASAVRNEAFTGQVQQDWDASVRVRFGALVTPGVLFYGTAGGAAGGVSSSFTYSGTTTYNYESAPGAPSPITHTTLGAGNWTDLRLGWTAGGGFEALLTKNWRVRAEYRYTDLGQFSKQVSLVRSSSDPVNLPNSGSLNSTVNFNAAFHTVRVGLAYAFQNY
jgi:outer membrane immunogenic protein